MVNSGFQNISTFREPRPHNEWTCHAQREDYFAANIQMCWANPDKPTVTLKKLMSLDSPLMAMNMALTQLCPEMPRKDSADWGEVQQMAMASWKTLAGDLE
ncbi:hypothetical protein diail_8633 [Diaporthe ilicicola]|nr:hypothetical protein diail_8633 [Diaporthe ilicicola]